MFKENNTQPSSGKLYSEFLKTYHTNKKLLKKIEEVYDYISEFFEANPDFVQYLNCYPQQLQRYAIYRDSNEKLLTTLLNLEDTELFDSYIKDFEYIDGLLQIESQNKASELSMASFSAYKKLNEFLAKKNNPLLTDYTKNSREVMGSKGFLEINNFPHYKKKQKQLRALFRTAEKLEENLETNLDKTNKIVKQSSQTFSEFPDITEVEMIKYRVKNTIMYKHFKLLEDFRDLRESPTSTCMSRTAGLVSER